LPAALLAALAKTPLAHGTTHEYAMPTPQLRSDARHHVAFVGARFPCTHRVAACTSCATS
jgi:hypothetical protein